MAAAYAVADGGQLSTSTELLAARHIDRFGVQAVYGRALTCREINAMTLAESVRNVYNQRAQANTDWSAWAQTYPDLSAFLNRAIKAAAELGYIDG